MPRPVRLLALVFAALAGREAFGAATQRDLSPTDWSQFRRALNDTRPTGGAPLYVPETRLEGHGGEPGGVPFGMFGGSVSLYGDTALVGAPYEGAAYVFVRTGGVWTLQQRLTPPADAQQFQPELFGTTVSLYGDTAVVGAPYHVPSSGQPGAAFVFVRNGTTWTLQQELLPPDTTQFQVFGRSVSISGDTVVVGAPLASTAGGVPVGAAYVFVRTGTSWTEEQQLMASDGADSDLFGTSVAIDGDTALVGAFEHSVAAVRSGSAYVFTRSGSTWTEQQELTPSDGGQEDWFGQTVALSGDTAVVGASREETPGNLDKGAAYVFSRSGTAWSQQQKLQASDGASGDNFGISVSVSVDTAVIRSAQSASANSAYVFVRSGAVWSEQQKLPMPAQGGAVSAAVFGDTAILGDPTAAAPEGYSDTGLALVFVRSGTVWTQQQLLRSPDDAVLDGIGSSVAASGDSAAVGAPADNTLGGINAGSAYVFVRSGATWSEQQKLTASDGSPGAGFGSSVSISGDTLVVGAPGEGTAGSQAGAAYVFVRSGATWSQQQKLLASDGSRTRASALRCRSRGTAWSWGRRGRHGRASGRRGLRVRPVGHDVEPAAEAGSRRSGPLRLPRLFGVVVGRHRADRSPEPRRRGGGLRVRSVRGGMDRAAGARGRRRAARRIVRTVRLRPCGHRGRGVSLTTHRAPPTCSRDPVRSGPSNRSSRPSRPPRVISAGRCPSR